MKKSTLFALVLLGGTMALHAQCFNTHPYPTDTVASNNSGDPQQINSCVYTGDYSTVSNLIVGNDYTFGLLSEGQPANRYITVSDIANNALAAGFSPLIVPAIGESTVRVHYSENESCGTAEWCLEAYLKVTLTCPFPTDIVIDGVTTTDAAFAWTPGGDETAWQVMVLPKGSAAPAASDTGTGVSGTPSYAVSDLEAGHRYQFYIRADCGAEFSPWRGPYDFNAACAPVAVLSENFDGVTDGELPACWSALKVGAAPDASVGIASLSNSAPNAIQLANDDSAPSAGIFLISPDLSTAGTATHRLKFYTRGYGNVSLQVGTTNGTTSAATFNLIQTVNATPNYTEHIVDFTGYIGSDTHIAFRHANTSTYNPVFIDDVRWEMAPLCPDVQDITVLNLAQSSAILGWEAGTDATGWDVVFSESEGNPDTLTPVSPAPVVPQVTLSGLSPNTNYYAWVRSACGETLGNGVWSNPISFTTACDPVATLNEDFDDTNYGELPQCWAAIIEGASPFNSSVQAVSGNAVSGSMAVSLFDGDGIPDSKIILVSPALSTLTTGTHRVKFNAKANGTLDLSIGTLDSAAPGGTFNELQVLTLTSAYAEYVVDFTGFEGTDTYIGFRHIGGQYAAVYLDDVRWELTPACADVTSLTVAATTDSSAFVDWEANGGETQWDIIYGTAEVDSPETLTPVSPAPSGDSETALSGLLPNTVYKVWVRSACGGTDGNGAWIGPVAFRTACLPVTALTEGFEDAPVYGLPDCWSAVLAGPTLGQYAAVRTVNNDAAFGNNAVEIHANSSAPTDKVMLVSPYLGNLAAGTHRLKFYALSYNAATPFEIGTMNGNSAQSTYSVFQSFTLGSGYNEYVVDFSGYTGTDTYIVFRNVAGNYNSTFIDNVRWEPVPACADVTNLQVSDVETGTATISWTAGDNDANAQAVYGPVTVSDPSTLTPGEVVGGSSSELSGLADNTSYNVWVRSVCGGPDGNGAWIGPVVFRTKCLPTSVPYSEDFQSPSLPELPECTTRFNAGNGSDWDTTWGESGYGFDGQVLRYNGNGNTANAWFFTRGVHLEGGAEYVISYKYGNNSSDNYSEKLGVTYGLAPDLGSQLFEIGDHGQVNTGMAIVNQVTFTPQETGDYYFGFHAYSDANQSQLFVDDISITPSLSVPDFEDGFQWYPNPVSDFLYLSAKTNISSVQVINLLGQRVSEWEPGTAGARVDLSALPSGSYLVRVTAADRVRTLKVLKR